MKYIVSLIALSALNMNAMFELTDSTANQLHTMLDHIVQVATEHNLTDNPAAQIYATMKDTITTNGCAALTKKSSVATWMNTMHAAYQQNEAYAANLKKGQALHPNDPAYDKTWHTVTQIAQTSIIRVTQAQSSFKCPLYQSQDLNQHYLQILTSNTNAKKEDADILIATTLICFYQYQERMALMQQTATQN
jgi:hypothetical protein